MKHATKYQKKIRKLMSGMKKVRPPEPPTGDEAVALLIESILQSDATNAQAREAFEAIEREFVDFNELRASPPKDIADCVKKDLPHRRRKAEIIRIVLNNIFQRTYNVSIDYMAKMTKRDLRRHLRELGLDAYAAGRVVMLVFGGHAVPVDESLVEVLRMKDCVHPDSDLDDVQGFLERIIQQKDDVSAHEFFRELVRKSSRALARKRQAEAKARREAEAKARAEEEAKAAELAAAEAARQAAKKAAARKSRKRKAVKVKTKAAKKATGKTRKEAARRPAAKRSAAKATGKAAGKAGRKR